MSTFFTDMNKTTIQDLPAGYLEGRRALVRVDYNVPVDASGTITDDTRIRASEPTLRLLRDAGARIVLLSHFGRPGGKADPTLSLRPVAARLAEFLHGPVEFCAGTVGEAVQRRVDAMDNGTVLMLENIRFQPGETSNDSALAEDLASLADVYVNDAFGAAHRAHASTVGVAQALRAKGGLAVAGVLMERELQFLGTALAEPQRPFVAVIGGAKITGKIDVIHSLLPRVDRLLVGGAMANTFFLALGLDVGNSLVEADKVDLAKELLDGAGDRLTLPIDCIVTQEISEDAPVEAVHRTDVGPTQRIVDIGPWTRELYESELRDAATILWNGPMGVFELAPFAEGTMAVAHATAEASDRGAVTILGGGDSAAAAAAAGVTDRLTHVSTGGGASLEFLAGATLPGVAALSENGDGV